ncbi:MAG: 6-aminohexanoate-dimer hydrolase [Pseudomonadota bacterium]
MRFRAFCAALAVAMTAGTVGAQTAQPAPPPPEASDPVDLGWMVGSPPPPDKIIAYDNLNVRAFPQARWAFANYRELAPSSRIGRGSGPVAKLPLALRRDIDSVTFAPLGGGAPMRWDAAFDAVYGDAILVLHRGKIVYERYAGVMNADQPHIAFSVTKSFVGTMAEMLIAEGKIDPAKRVDSYIVELAGSAFADATVRQVLDMTTGLDYSEDYTDPRAHVAAYAMAAGLRPRPSGYVGPQSTTEFLVTVAKKGEHGSAFAYKTVNTEVLAWLIARVTGKRVHDVLTDKIWSRLGAENDAYMIIDRAGMGVGGAGLNATLRDMARFGEMMRLGGRFNGQQIVPASVVNAIADGASRDDFAKAGYKMLPGWSYKSQWWVSHNAHGAFAARGIHGQTIYIDPKAEMVIVRFASNPVAANSHFDPISLPAYQAVAEQLMRGKGKGAK